MGRVVSWTSQRSGEIITVREFEAVLDRCRNDPGVKIEGNEGIVQILSRLRFLGYESYDFPANQPYQIRFALRTSLLATCFTSWRKKEERKKKKEVNSRQARKVDVHKIREVLGATWPWKIGFRRSLMISSMTSLTKDTCHMTSQGRLTFLIEAWFISYVQIFL